MNGAHLHLLLNHFPVVCLIISLLILGHGLYHKSQDFVRAGLIIAVLAGLFTIPTYLTGEPAEEFLETRTQISEELVEPHEDAALFSLLSISTTALASLAALYFSYRKAKIPKPLMIGVLVLMVWALAVVARTNYLGGQISHPELRPVEANP